MGNAARVYAEPMTLDETMSHPSLRVHEHKFQPGTPYWHDVDEYCEHGEKCAENDAAARDGFMVDWLLEQRKGNN
jgi:hypothetical protein